ncbi:MAG: hypothetical protein ACE5GX_16590 [Thermoanaerobaculia bacterium]
MRAQQFEDEVLVQEVALVVDFSNTESLRDLDELRATEVVVLEDGQARKVTRLQPIASVLPAADEADVEGVTVCPWTVLIYVDAVLADPATIFEAALALGQQSESLTELGCVGIVKADPIPEVLVTSSRSPEYVEKILVDLATVARAERDRLPARPQPPPGEERRGASKVEAQWDRLLSFVAGRRSSGPKALFLISDGFALSTTDIEILSGRERLQDVRAGARPLADMVADTAQTLASYGWLTIATPHVPGRSKPPETRDRFDIWRDEVEGRIKAGDRRSVINFFGRTQASRPTGDLDDRLYEAYLLPDLAPLRALAAATSGEVVWSQLQLNATLENLGERRLLWFQTTEPHDGRIRRLQVRLLDTGTYVEAPWWKRSSTPDLVAESRLRRLLAGEPLSPTLEVTAQVLPALSGSGGMRPQSELRVRVSPVAFGDRVSIGHVRISIGFADSTAIRSFQHLIDYEASPLGDPWTYTLPLETVEGTSRLAVGVEDLSLEEWGATIVELSSAGDSRRPENLSGAAGGRRRGQLE